MKKIQIEIENKKACLTTYAEIICDNSDYVIEFTFDSEWNVHRYKTARFVPNGGKPIEVIFEGNTCPVPAMIDTTGVSIGVYASDISTSTPVYVYCVKSIRSLGGAHVEPPKDVYDQLMERLNDLIAVYEDMLVTNGTQGLTYNIYSDHATCTGIGEATGTDIEIASVARGRPVTGIEGDAFRDCDSLRIVSIPASITSIGDWAFQGCINLKDVYITDMKAWLNISFGVGASSNPLFYADNLYLNGELITELVIPDGVTSIGADAFAERDNITSVTIPDSVTSIGNTAFKGCDGLTSVTIGNGVTSIGDRAFEGCYNLTSVTIPASVIKLCEAAFNSCWLLESVTFEEDSQLEELEAGVFADCFKLKEIHLPKGVKKIGVYMNCASLNSIHIPIGVTEITAFAFLNCTSLKDVYYEGTEADWAKVNISTSGNDALATATIHFESEV